MRSTSTVIPSLIVVDLDGTLSVLNEYSPECREAMRKVQEKGSRAVLATARGIEEGEVYAVGSYYSLDYLILEGGNVILEKQDRDYGRIEAWDEKLRKEKADLRLFREIFLGRYEKVDDSFRGVPFWKLFIEPISGEEFHAFVHSEVVQIGAESPETISRLMPTINGILEENGLNLKLIDYPSYGTRVEVNAATKDEAVLFLAKRLGISLDSVCAIGDSENDTEMLELAGIPATVSNGAGSLKKLVLGKGGMIASEEATRGVTQILVTLLDGAGKL